MTAPTTVAAGDNSPARPGPGRVLGLDGKSYPGASLSAEDQAFVIGHVHALKHIDGLSVRQIVARLSDDLCIRRSVGWVSTTLRTWRCDHCPTGVQVPPFGTPEHPAGATA